MTRPLLLDRLFGPDWPNLATPQQVAAIESIPLTDRLAALNTYDALRIGAAHDPDAPAIRLLPNADPADTPVTLSHREFLAGVTQTANALHQLGVGSTDTVSFLLPLVPQAFMTLFGAETAGIANPVNPLLEPYQLAEILRAARTKVLVTLGPVPGSDIWDKVQRIREDLPELSAIVVVGAQGVVTTAPSDAGLARPAGQPVPVFDFDALIAAQAADRLVSGRTIAADDTAAYFHTGGTTGTPKLVRHTHLNQVTQAWVIGLMLHIDPGESVLYGLPLFHVGGALTQALAFLSNGAHLVVVSPAGWRNPNAVRSVWKLVQQYRPVNMVGVPTVLVAALTIPVNDADLSSLKRAAGGGAAIPVAVARTYSESMGLPVLEVYGMTETASVHTISYMDRPIRLGSVGHPVPYAKVRVVKIDADGRYQGDCATNEIGVVAMAGPGVFSGYLSEEHNRSAFVESGWVNSGDLGRFDEEGYLWITGRAKDLVIRGGHNIDPQPIEEILFSHPAVELAAMVGRPDAYAGELPVAYVQLKAGALAQPEDLIDYVRERTPERAAVPVAVHLISPMPLTGVGKVFKPALRLDAARRVAQALIGSLELGGGQAQVDASTHPLHGSLITVRLSNVPAALHAEVERAVQEALGPLTLHHELAWA